MATEKSNVAEISAQTVAVIGGEPPKVNFVPENKVPPSALPQQASALKSSPASASTASIGTSKPPTKTGTAAVTKSPVPSKPSSPKGSASPIAKTSLVARTAAIMGHTEALPPASIEDGDTDQLTAGFFHGLLYGPPDTFKTTTAGMFMGPEATRFIITRRKEQMIPLAKKGFKFKVVHDAEALRYALLYPEKLFGEAWANHPNRTLVVDDCTEGTAVLVDDHKAYFNDKGELVQVKDPRRSYKAAGDELHDLLKINLAKPQHVVLTAVQKEFEVEGTIDYRIEPDLPTKMMMLTETEMEFVFYMEPGDKGKMLTRPRLIMRQGKEKNPVTKQPDMWREITFAKQKFPLAMLGKKILLDKEEKNLADVWRRVSAALRGEIIPAPQPQGIKFGAGANTSAKK